jgi:hypothetical protein
MSRQEIQADFPITVDMAGEAVFLASHTLTQPSPPPVARKLVSGLWHKQYVEVL